jgi:MFS family permease
MSLGAAEQGRALIARALVRLGHPGIVDPDLDPEARPLTPSSRLGRIAGPLRRRRDSLKYQIEAASTLAAIYFVVSLLLGLSADAGHLAPLGVVFAILGLGLLGAIDDAEGAALALVLAVLIAWLTALVILFVHDWVSVLYAYVAPAFVVGALVFALPTRFPLRDQYDVALSVGGVVRSAPLLGPVLLGLFAIAVFNSSLWRAAEQLHSWRIAAVLALTIGPLVLVVRARLRGQLGDVLQTRADCLAHSGSERSDRLQREIKLAVSDATPEEIERCVAAVLADYWPEQPAEYASELEASEGKVLLAPVTMRLLLTVLLVGSIVLVYVYVLAWVAVPADVAKAWIVHGSAVAHVNLLVVHLVLPGGAYFRVSVLLSSIATAAFLGAAAFDDRVERPLTEAILGEPAARFLILALPYYTAVRKSRRSSAPAA